MSGLDRRISRPRGFIGWAKSWLIGARYEVYVDCGDGCLRARAVDMTTAEESARIMMQQPGANAEAMIVGREGEFMRVRRGA